MTSIIPTRVLIKTAFLLLLLFAMQKLRAQDSTRQSTIYSVVYNHVPNRFPAPLIGFVNIAEGDQKGAQIGFINLNKRHFEGAQIGFLNGASGRVNGGQVGFVNLCKDSLNGAQVGYVNLVSDKMKGTQIGFVNLCKDSFTGAQIGFVNESGSRADGAQVGFVNFTRDSFTGTQVGFVNVADKASNGAQVGFVNVSPKNLRGAQIGFINIVDSVEKGVPFGFISYVRKNGYQALELGFSEMYPVQLSFKIGLKPFYTFAMLSANPDFREPLAAGFGVGSLMPISKSFYFNPELIWQNSLERRTQDMTILAAQFGLSVSKRLMLVGGPSFVWSQKERDNGGSLYDPAYTWYKHSIDKQNRLHAGARLAIRYSFNK